MLYLSVPQLEPTNPDLSGSTMAFISENITELSTTVDTSTIDGKKHNSSLKNIAKTSKRPSITTSSKLQKELTTALASSISSSGKLPKTTPKTYKETTKGVDGNTTTV